MSANGETSSAFANREMVACRAGAAFFGSSLLNCARDTPDVDASRDTLIDCDFIADRRAWTSRAGMFLEIWMVVMLASIRIPVFVSLVNTVRRHA